MSEPCPACFESQDFAGQHEVTFCPAPPAQEPTPDWGWIERDHAERGHHVRCECCCCEAAVTP